MRQKDLEGIIYLEKAVEANYPKAHYLLGQIYLEGKFGFAPNNTKACNHFRKAQAAGIKLEDMYKKNCTF